MKTRVTLITALLAWALVTAPTQAGQAQSGGVQIAKGKPSAVAPLSVTEKSDLLFMHEEEKLARDVYTQMAKLWKAQVFANIAVSENTHFNAIGKLLSTYALADSTPATPGVYNNAELQALYDDLIARGSTSLTEALTVGGLIEEVDIEDLDSALASTTRIDIRRVYENLQCGSRNHLRAFVRNLEFQGVVYEAQHLAQADVDAILSTPMERCGR
jgi:hypothetical protein